MVSDILDDSGTPSRERLRAASLILDREYPVPQRAGVNVLIPINVGIGAIAAQEARQARTDDTETVDGVAVENENREAGGPPPETEQTT